MVLFEYLKNNIISIPFIILIVIMCIDIATGVLCAVVGTSKNNDNGKIESRQFLKGIIRKVGYIAVYILSVLFDFLTNSNTASNMIVYFFIGGQSLSILENVSLLGVPFPEKFKNLFEFLSKKGDDKENDG